MQYARRRMPVKLTLHLQGEALQSADTLCHY